MNLFELTKHLINIPSVSGDEEAVGFFLRDYLENLRLESRTANGFEKSKQYYRPFE